MSAPSLAERAAAIAAMAGHDVPDDARITIWVPGRRSWHLRTVEEAARSWASIEANLKKHDRRDHDGRPASAYIGMALTRAGLDPGHRGGKEDVVSVNTLYADVDVLGGQHKQTNLPKRDHALEVLRELPLPPTRIIDSGGGLYPIWELAEPFDVRESHDATAFEQLLASWQAVIRAQLAPHHVDNTADVTRLLRPAHALNRKYDVRVRLVEEHPERLYNPSDFEEWLDLGRGCDVTSRAGRWRGELPTSVPGHLRAATEALGLLRVKHNALVLTNCPDCGHIGTVAAVSPVSGVLTCKRETCGAHLGLAFEDWTQQYLPSAHLARVLALTRGSREVIDIGRAEWPAIQLGDVFESVSGWIDKARDLGASSLVLGVLEGGAGKTRALAQIALHDTGLAVILRSHKHARDFMEELELLAEQHGVEKPRVAYCKGVRSGGCELWPRLEATKAAGLVKRSLCRACPSHGTCAATRVPGQNELILAVVDSMAMLEQNGVLKGRLVVIDEIPTEEIRETVDSQVAEDVARYREEYASFGDPYAGKFAMLFGTAIREVVEAAKERYRSSGSRHDSWLVGQELKDLVQSTNGWRNLLDAASFLGGMQPTKLPTLSIKRVLHGSGYTEPFPHQLELEYLWRALCALDIDGEEDRRAAEASVGRLYLVAGPRGVRFEVARPRTLGLGRPAGTLLLSATGLMRAAKLAAANPHMDIETVGAQVDGVPGSRLVRVFAPTGDSTRRSLLDGGALRLMARSQRPRAEGVLVRALTEALRYLRKELGDPWAQRARQKVGLITFKGVIDVLESDQDLRARIEERSDVTLGPLGYFGLDETGSNAFSECQILVLLGDHLPNLGAIGREADLLGIDPERALSIAHEEPLAQGELRLRHLRRSEPVAVVAVRRRVPAIWPEGAYEELPRATRGRSSGAVDALVELAESTGGPISLTEALYAFGRREKPLLEGQEAKDDSLQRDPSVGSRPWPRQTLRDAFPKAVEVLGWDVSEVPNGEGRGGRPERVAHPPTWSREELLARVTTQRMRRRACPG